MHRIAVLLDEWRAAERQRDALPRGIPEWQAAEEEAQHARTAYRAEASQAAAYYAELDFAAHDRRLALWPRRVADGPASFPDDRPSFARAIIALLPILAFGEVRLSSSLPGDRPGNG